MGVHGLWDLLAPVGRRVSVETLAGKKLAIDASIWMVQFMKAMRDEKGEMVRNAHLLGFFRRICKLLFLRTRPVFVFDGATPALKRRTVMKRRKNRDKAQANVRKTAEKLLLNHLKAMRLKELADDIKNQMEKQKNDATGKKPDQSNSVGNDSGKNDVSSINYNQEKLDEMLAASISAEEDGSLANISTMSAANPYDEDDDEDEVMILPDMLGEVDPAVLAALTPSLQLDLLQKQKQNNDAKGKGILSDKAGSNSGGDDIVSSSCNQQKLDEMLAASLMEEEKRSLTNKASTSTAPYLIEEDGNINDDEDEDEDEEMILPAMDGGVDPSILASLPPSMQLDLLVQIRERLMAENRQKYQKVKKDPGKFSELQIQAYLKTVAFRREIDQVQKAAAGRGVGGVQTSRIASEANREFIFSSSFTGDKQVLASGRAEKRGYEQQALEEHPSSFMQTAVSASKSKTRTGEKPSGDRRVFDGNIETYVDERGRVCVSRVRAMGIRMTRDLQRNLDLMKEIEQGRENVESLESESNSAIPTTLSRKTVIRTSHDRAESIKRSEAIEDSVLKSDASIEISFEDDGNIKCLDGDDDIFARLVTENPIGLSSDNVTPSGKLSSASDSDCDWEEGTIEAKDKILSDDANLSIKPPFSEGYNCDDSEVEWEEGVCEITEHTASTIAETRKNMYSKGYLEEEADLQEAIRRSLGDIEVQKSDYLMPRDGKVELPGGNAFKGTRFLDPEDRTEEPLFSEDDGIQRNVLTCNIADGVGVLDVSKSNDSHGSLFKSSIVCNPDDSRILADTPCESHMGSPKQSIQDASKRADLSKESPHAESITTSGVQEVNVLSGDRLCTSDEVGWVSTPSDTCPKYNPQTSDALHVNVPDASSVHNQKIAAEAELSCPLTNSAVPLSKELMIDSICGIDNKEKLAVKNCDENWFQEIDSSLENSALKENEYFQVESTEADLEEELRILGQERMDLGDEQRRLERNAESASSEMYIECQELLQMFGIPYIIAPMEAEAQCAYMELANLVDGVVTDDSDTFLFGARSVYKNIFDDRKYVETYFMKDIESELGLTREKLIRMALLLGSDYTEGVSGIGIVNAVEVLNAFPEEGGLQEFRDWIESPDPTILGKLDTQTDSGALKKGSRTNHDKICSQSNTDEASASHENSSEAPEQNQSADQIHERRKIFMDTHRKVSKNWHIPSSFPSEAVVSAYLSPEVDKSTEPFAWAKPDHFVLRKLCWEKFGWGSQKADELILPVLKEYNKRETQRRLEEFYTFNERFAKFRSKRIKKAVKGITGKQSLELMDDAAPEVSGSKNKRKSRNNESEDDRSEKLPRGTEENIVRNQTNYRKKSTPKQLRKRTELGDAIVSESPVSSDGRQGTKSRRAQMSGNCRGRRGRGRTAGGGKRKESPTDKASEISSSNDEEEEVHMQTQEGPVELRRSTRSRNHVDYTANDSDTDDLDKSVDKGDKQWFDEEASKQDSPWGLDPCENAALGLGQEKQHNNENVTPEQGLDTDYLEKGGGFCPDNDDNDQPDVKEYFKTGGGFCMEEDETCPDENSVHRRATTVVVENAHLSHSSSLVKADADVSKPTMDDPPSTKMNDQLKSTMLLQENDTNSGQTIPVGALRSMPHLRRKRKKS